MKPLTSIALKSHFAKAIVAGFFLVLFTGFQFTLLSHHHTEEAHLSHDHSVKQQCEICLYLFSKQHQFLAPTSLQIPEATVLAFIKNQFAFIIADVQQVHSQLANRGPPVS